MPIVADVTALTWNGSLDGEVNSHSVWPTEDGKTVVEGEEDFDAIVSDQRLGNVTFGDNDTNTIPGVGISPIAGDDFEANQTSNTVTVAADSVTVDEGSLAGNVYPAPELEGNQPKLDGGTVTGEAVWIGQACDAYVLLNADAVDERHRGGPPGCVHLRGEAGERGRPRGGGDRHLQQRP